MFGYLDKPVFTVLGYHVTIGLVVVVLVVAWHYYRMKKA